MPNADELNELLGRLLDERAADHEAITREREVLGLLVVECERHSQALQSAIERAKSRLVGITPAGTTAR